MKDVLRKSLTLDIVGIMKPNSNSSVETTGVIGYTSDLTKYVIENINDSKIVKEQNNNKDININEIAIIINTAPKEYMMHYVYTGPEVVYLVEQMKPSNTDPYHWEIKIFATWPDVDLG